MKLSEEFLKGIWKENPVLVLILGMCPSLATSSNAVNGRPSIAEYSTARELRVAPLT